MKIEELIRRVEFLIAKGHSALTNKKHGEYPSMTYVSQGDYSGFRSSALSFITEIYGDNHSYFKEFQREVNNSYDYNIESGVSILQSIKSEIEHGWLTKIKQLITAEIFSDFLEMSKYLLDENYKDPAAVMIGSVLEEHLRQLCNTYSVDITIIKGTDIIAKKADLLNADLAKSGVYNILEQKSVTAWLDLRNRAAHGKYTDYTIEHVRLMYQGVLDFVSRTK